MLPTYDFIPWHQVHAGFHARMDEHWSQWVAEFARLEATCSVGFTPNVKFDVLLEKILWQPARIPAKDPKTTRLVDAEAWKFDALWDEVVAGAKPSPREAWSERARNIHQRLQRQLERRTAYARRIVFESVARMWALCGLTVLCITQAGRTRAVLAADLDACRLADREATIHPAFAPPRAVI